ncbi:MAG: DUF2277 domain-containing protein [Bryobacteraceae bacterium]
MCRSIKQLRGQEPTSEDMQKAALQFVRKISGYSKPSKANQEAFEKAVAQITQVSEQLLGSLPATPSPVRTASPRLRSSRNAEQPQAEAGDATTAAS